MLQLVIERLEMFSVSSIRVTLLSLMILLSALLLYAHDHRAAGYDPAVAFPADSPLLMRTGILSVMPSENVQFQKQDSSPIASSRAPKLQPSPISTPISDR
jgi:hypothetical protein